MKKDKKNKKPKHISVPKVKQELTADDFSSEQIEAMFLIENWWNMKDKQVFELSGIAGSGKTTIINYIIDRLKIKRSRILFCAFSGRAVSEMIKKGINAQTVHSAIYEYHERFKKDFDGKVIRNDKGYPIKEKVFELKPRLDKNYELIVLDEAGMVGLKLGSDLLSYGIPTICLGDINQLPPVMDRQMFMANPDYHLSQPHRQNADSPIIELAQMWLNDMSFKYGIYGSSSVIRMSDVSEKLLKWADIIIVGKNNTKDRINMIVRKDVKGYKKLEYPHEGERVICRRNNWDKYLNNGIPLTNGTTGIIQKYDKSTFDGLSFLMDFKPDYSFNNECFKNLQVDYNYLQAIDLNSLDKDTFKQYMYESKFFELFDYGYAITAWASQGGQWPKVLFFCEDLFKSKPVIRRGYGYTSITRAMDSIIIVTP